MKTKESQRSTRDARCVEVPAAQEVAPESVPRGAFQHFAALAAKVPPDAVQVARVDPRVILANVRFAMANLGVTPEEVRVALPKAPVEKVFEVQALAMAFTIACERVRDLPSAGEVQRRLARLRPQREAFLGMAEVLAGQGYLDKTTVANIRAGNGPYDAAVDAVNLAELYTQHWDRLRGLHPFKREALDAMKDDGQWLLEHLAPSSSQRAEGPRKDQDRDTRDRLWTMILERYDWLQRIAHVFHGDAYEAKVPRLRSQPPAPAATDEATPAGAGPVPRGAPAPSTPEAVAARPAVSLPAVEPVAPKHAPATVALRPAEATQKSTVPPGATYSFTALVLGVPQTT
jgi:hypothetical protein